MITAGTFDANVLGTVAIPVSFTSSLFDITGVLDLGFGPKGTCEPCLPGQTVTFSTVLAGPDPASGTINGTFYPAFTLEGVYNFTSPSVQLPSGLQALQTTTLTLPFSMSGTFNAFSTSPQTPILVDLPVTGQGSLYGHRGGIAIQSTRRPACDLHVLVRLTISDTGTGELAADQQRRDRDLRAPLANLAVDFDAGTGHTA